MASSISEGNIVLAGTPFVPLELDLTTTTIFHEKQIGYMTLRNIFDNQESEGYPVIGNSETSFAEKVAKVKKLMDYHVPTTTRAQSRLSISNRLELYGAIKCTRKFSYQYHYESIDFPTICEVRILSYATSFTHIIMMAIY
jgi:hypothetical protein